MPKADKTSTTLAATATNVVPFARPPKPRSTSIEDLARLEFGDEGPALKKAIGSFEDWIDQAKRDWNTFLFAEATIRKTDVQMSSIVREVGCEMITELAGGFDILLHRYIALAEVLQAAHIRTMCGLARAAIAAEEQNAGGVA